MAAEGALTTAIVALLIANAWMLVRQLGLIQASPHQPSSYMEAVMREIWEKRLKDDPPLGSELAPLRKFRGRCLVVVIERCTDCVIGKLKMLSEVAEKRGISRLVIITGDNRERAKQVLESCQIKAEIIVDPKGEFSKMLNAFFTPRAYIVENGKILWKQEELEMIPFEILSEVRKQ